MRNSFKTLFWALLVLLPAISYIHARTKFKTTSATASATAAATTGSVSVVGQTAGPTAFIVNVQLQANPPDSVQSVKFSIVPKPGSVTRPIAATYFADYLQNRGYLNSQTGSITIPVFGLYSNFSNTVNFGAKTGTVSITNLDNRSYAGTTALGTDPRFFGVRRVAGHATRLAVMADLERG